MNSQLPSVPDDFPVSAYRDRTITMLRRYNRASVETGRLPSLVGREFFRSRVTSYTVHTLEDAVIFVADVESCLAELNSTERRLIGHIVLQEYSQFETARLMGSTERTIRRCFQDAIDHLSEIMLEHHLLSPSILAPRRHRRWHLIETAAIATAPAAVTSSQHAPVADRKPVVPIREISIQACQAPKNGVFAASA